MAEVFGAVASAVGVLGVAAQCADGIKKLRDFQKDVKGAPEEISYIADELELLTISIASIEAQIRRSSHTTTGVEPTGALILCQRCIMSTVVIVKDLDKEIAKRKVKGSLKAAWNKKVLEGYMTRIERAKTSLTIACSTYDRELNQQGFTSVDQKFDQLQSAFVTYQCSTLITATDPSPQKPALLTTCVYTSGEILPDEGEEKSTEPIAHRQKRYSSNAVALRNTRTKKTAAVNVAHIHFRLPSWLLARSIVLDIRRTAQSWTVNLQPRRLVPNDNDFLQACEFGDIVTARELLAEGKASIYDVDGFDYTALHKLAQGIKSGRASDERGSLQLLDLLVDSGADLNASDCIGRLPLNELFSRCYHYSSGPGMQHEVFHRLAANLEEETFLQQLTIATFFIKDMDLEILRVSREYLRSDRTSLVTRVEAFLDITVPHADVLDLWIGNDNWERVWAECPSWMCHKLIAKMSYRFGICVVAEDRKTMELWRSIFRRAVAYCGTRQTSDRFPTHIFWRKFVTGYRRSLISASSDAASTLEEELRTCMNEMVACGIDLEAIGRNEPGLQAADTVDGPQEWVFYVRDEGRKWPSITVRVIAVIFGAQPSECQLWLSDPVADATTTLFSEFWEMVEHQELRIPGAWTAEEVQFDSCAGDLLRIESKHQIRLKETRKHLYSMRVLADEVSQTFGDFWNMIDQLERQGADTCTSHSKDEARPWYRSQTEKYDTQIPKWVVRYVRRERKSRYWQGEADRDHMRFWKMCFRSIERGNV